MFYPLPSPRSQIQSMNHSFPLQSLIQSQALSRLFNSLSFSFVPIHFPINFKMSRLFLASLLLIICSQISISDGAVARARVKRGAEYTFDVPGKLVVKRVTKNNGEQYLYAHTDLKAFTSDGANKIGSASLDFATGKLVIRNFSEDDVGSYTFPMEPPNIREGPDGKGCSMVGPTQLELELEQ